MMSGLSILLGKIIYLFFSHFSLDKVCGVWYNGNNARLGRGRAAEKSIGKNAQKNRGFYPSISHAVFISQPSTIRLHSSVIQGSSQLVMA